MSNKKSETGASTASAAHAIRFVSCRADRTFVVEITGGPTLCAVPDSTGWRLEAAEGTSWRLRRSRSNGFVLELSQQSREIARTMPPVGVVGGGLKYLLVEDGRLFRMTRSGPREAGYELTGWETPGAYVSARPEPNGWSLEPRTSSHGLIDLTVPCLMLAAEILDAEGLLDAPGASAADESEAEHD